MIQLQDISVAFGGQVVLDGVTWTIKPGQHIGLVGPNGAGKSTILRVITGQLRPDSGSVSFQGDVRLGYLEQESQEVASGKSVLATALEAFDEILALQAEDQRIAKWLESTQDFESEEYVRTLNRFEQIHTQLANFDAHLIEAKAEVVLKGLGFQQDDLNRPLDTFSGGWRMRVALARILLREPEALLLDEPTNHLDIDSIQWMEAYLKDYKGTVVIVSHDRYFLDRMINVTAELQHGKVTEYAGNYEFYLEDRKLRRQMHKAAYENQQREIAQTERFIQRFRAKATKAKQAQSKIKALERMERIPEPVDDSATVSFRFPVPDPSGKTVLSISRFSKDYPTPNGKLTVFKDADELFINRGDKIALIGQNGAGKSTLARIINGTEPFDGVRTMGHNVTSTFFAQNQAESLAPKKTILESLVEVSRGMPESQIRSLLGAFLFTGDDVFKKIAVLSGGERSRVALAKTLLVPSNFLILDEPTNHLDIQSVSVLIEALVQYTGTFIVVSHDRHFLDRICNHVWRVEHGRVDQYQGNYSDYLWQTEHGTRRSGDIVTPRPPSDGSSEKTRQKSKSTGKKSREQKRKEAEERAAAASVKLDDQTDFDDLSDYQLKKLYSKVEQKIFQKERAQRKLEKDLGDPKLYEDLDRARTLNADYTRIKAELDELYERWEQISERLPNPS